MTKNLNQNDAKRHKINKDDSDSIQTKRMEDASELANQIQLALEMAQEKNFEFLSFQLNAALITSQDETKGKNYDLL